MLWPFNHYPGTDYETFNWDWLIGLGKKMEKALHDLFSDTGALHQMVNKVLGEHPEWTTTVMDGAITWNKLNADVQDRIILLSNYTGSTPTEKMQNAFDQMLDNSWKLIIDIDVTLDNDIEVSHDSESGIIYITSINHATLNLNGHSFVGDLYTSANGGLTFVDCVIEGTGYETVCRLENLIRLSTINCYIKNVESFASLEAVTGGRYGQQIVLNTTVFRNIPYIIYDKTNDIHWIYSMNISNCQFEKCGAITNFKQMSAVSLKNIVFEGSEYTDISAIFENLVVSQPLTVRESYFENNKKPLVKIGSDINRTIIDFSNNIWMELSEAVPVFDMASHTGAGAITVKGNLLNGITGQSYVFSGTTNQMETYYTYEDNFNIGYGISNSTFISDHVGTGRNLAYYEKVKQLAEKLDSVAITTAGSSHIIDTGSVGVATSENTIKIATPFPFILPEALLSSATITPLSIERERWGNVTNATALDRLLITGCTLKETATYTLTPGEAFYYRIRIRIDL